MMEKALGLTEPFQRYDLRFLWLFIEPPQKGSRSVVSLLEEYKEKAVDERVKQRLTDTHTMLSALNGQIEPFVQAVRLKHLLEIYSNKLEVDPEVDQDAVGLLEQIETILVPFADNFATIILNMQLVERQQNLFKASSS